MRRARHILTAIILLPIRMLAGPSDPLGPQFVLFPAPQKIEAAQGRGLLYTELKAVVAQNADQVRLLSGLPATLPVLGPTADMTTPGTISLRIDRGLELPSKEGYILKVLNGTVSIRANAPVGLFYGIQTLNQLLEDAKDQDIPVPACVITDYPSIATRAIHLDLKHHLDAGFYYYHIIDVLSSIKINTVIIEFEDKLRYRKAPLVGAPQAISIEEFRAISNYAHDRFIEISPLVQGLGHASFILKHDAYKELRDDPKSDWAFDPLNSKTYDLQFALYEDAMEATPYGKYLHIGGDEVGRLGQSELAKRSGMTPIQLQMHWLKKVTDFAIQHHRTPIFWDDMVFKLSDLYRTTYDPDMRASEVDSLWNKNRPKLDANISLFPANCIYMRWNYEAPDIPGNKKAIDWYRAHNLDVMPATSAQQSYAVLQRNHSNFPFIRDFCRIAKDKGLDKILCTVWDDSSPHFETIWRGLYDFAWCSWNGADSVEKNVHAAWRHRFFAPALTAPEFECRDLLETSITFWETAFLQEGDRESYYPDFKLMELPKTSPKGEWSRQYQKKLEGAAQTMDNYREVKDRIARCENLARRNRYELEVLDQINELQAYSSKLLLLLKQYDEQGTKENLQKIRECLNTFPVIRKELEQVFAKTRMMRNPEGYQRDANLHLHLANGTDNTDWMYYYELAMNKKLDQWLHHQGID